MVCSALPLFSEAPTTLILGKLVSGVVSSWKRSPHGQGLRSLRPSRTKASSTLVVLSPSRALKRREEFWYSGTYMEKREITGQVFSLKSSELPMFQVLGNSLSKGEVYCCITDSAGWAVVIGSACRCTTFQVPSSGLKIVVTLRANGVMSSLAPSLAMTRSIHTM